MTFASSVFNGQQTPNGLAKQQTPGSETKSVQTVSHLQLNERDFKRKIINDLLSHLDYHSAEQNGVVEVRKEEIAQELERLSVRALIAWYEAFLFVRSEMMYAGYELNGLRIIDHPADILRKLMKSDPEFDIQQYIF